MSSSSYGVLVTWRNSMSSCKFWKIFWTLLTLHFVLILILLLCYLSVEMKILSKLVLVVLIVIFYKKSVFIRKSIIQNLRCRCRLIQTAKFKCPLRFKSLFWYFVATLPDTGGEDKEASMLQILAHIWYVYYNIWSLNLN